MRRRARLRHIIVAEFVFLIGFAMMVPILPLYGRELGAAGTMIGLLLAANQAVDFVFAPVAGRLSDRYGRRSVLLPAMALTAVAYLGVGLSPTLGILFLVWTVAGLGSAHVLLSQAYVADVTDDSRRTKGMGFWGAGFALAFVVGPPTGALLFEAGGMLAAAVAAGIALIATAYAVIFLGEPPNRAVPKERGRAAALRHLKELRRTVLTVVVLNFAVIFIWSQFTTILPLFSADVLGWEVREYGMYLGAVGIISAVLQGGLVGPLVKRLGHGGPVALGFGLLGAGLGVLATARGPVTLTISAFGIAVGFGLLIPTLPALLSMNVKPERKGLALGVFQSASTLARVIAPLLAGIAYDRGFASAPFVMSATFGLLMMVVVTLLRLREPGKTAA